jgi:hypothetical protein
LVEKLREAGEISKLFYSGADIQPGINSPGMSETPAEAEIVLLGMFNRM